MRFDMVSICSAGAINREDLRAVRLVIVRFTVAMATGDPLALTAAVMADGHRQTIVKARVVHRTFP
jgi:hypothetical protein